MPLPVACSVNVASSSCRRSITSARTAWARCRRLLPVGQRREGRCPPAGPPLRIGVQRRLQLRGRRWPRGCGSGIRTALMAAPRPAIIRRHARAWPSQTWASTSAMCSTFWCAWPAAGRPGCASDSPCRRPPACGARVASRFAILRFSISVESSGCSTENTPPNPQQSSASGSARTSAPRTCSSSSARLAVHAQPAVQMAGRVVRDRPIPRRAAVRHAQHVHQVLGELIRSACQVPGPLSASHGSSVEQLRVVVPDHVRAGARRHHHVALRGFETRSSCVRATRRASARSPALNIGWPQQVCSRGNSTRTPRAAARCTVASPTSGKNVSTRHVTKSCAVRMLRLYINAVLDAARSSRQLAVACVRSRSCESPMVLFRGHESVSCEHRRHPSRFPNALQRLGELAYNLWWTWQPEAARALRTPGLRPLGEPWSQSHPLPAPGRAAAPRIRPLDDPEYLALYDSRLCRVRCVHG